MNKFLTYMVEKLGKGKPPTPTNIAWNIAPKINAVFRNGTQDDRRVLLDGFLGQEKPEVALKVATKCHNKQTREVKALYDDVVNRLNIYNNCVVTMIDNKYKEYTGLLANKLMSKYNKVAFVFRQLDPCTLSGSYRSPVDIIDLLNNSGLITAQGHGCAAGCFLKMSNAKKFVSWFDEQDIDLTDDIQVAARIKPEDITYNLCKTVCDNEGLFGQGVVRPIFASTFNLKNANINVFKKRNVTIKITYDNVDFLMFRAKEEDVDAFTNNGNITVVYSLGLNEYNGTTSVQGIIERYEIKQELVNWNEIFK